MLIHPVGRADVTPYRMPRRFRTEIVYFMTPGNGRDIPNLPEGEYWIRLSDARRWLEDLVVHVISPLDAEAVAEIELSEDHEGWLAWMVEHEIEHVRIDMDGTS
jgi:hypothetical protein